VSPAWSCFFGWLTFDPWLCRGSPGGYASVFELVVFPRLTAPQPLAWSCFFGWLFVSLRAAYVPSCTVEETLFSRSSAVGEQAKVHSFGDRFNA
jgi:uncharacterized membrane protein